MKRSGILAMLCVAVSSLAIIYQNTRVTALKKENKANTIARFKDSITIVSLKDIIIQHGQCINLEVSKEFMISDSASQSLQIGKALNFPNSKKLIVYHFDETNCFACVEKELPMIETLIGRFGKDRILIMGSFTKPRNLFLTLQRYNTYNVPVYNLPPSYLVNKRITSLNAPYFFAIDSAFNVSNIFIPSKDDPALNEHYIDFIANND